MKVNLFKLSDGQYIDATISKPKSMRLPDHKDGWRFNFREHSKKAFCDTYVLVANETPAIIEGCLVFRLKNGEPYMAYIETAPHNQGAARRFENAAGCLVAFACRLSFIHGQGHFKGWLAFDVLEERKVDEIKLMAMYCKKYGAQRWDTTTMVISPAAGEKLITQYLDHES